MAYSKNLIQINKQLHIKDDNNKLMLQIRDVLSEFKNILNENNWSDEEIKIREKYDSFRIINLCSKHLNDET